MAEGHALIIGVRGVAGVWGGPAVVTLVTATRPLGNSVGTVKKRLHHKVSLSYLGIVLH